MPVADKRSLLSLDPDVNRYRFFVLELHELDDGRAEIQRRWGRVGTSGRTRAEVFTSAERARKVWDALLARRVKRGYLDATDEELRTAGRLLAWRRAAQRAPGQRAFPAAFGF